MLRPWCPPPHGTADWPVPAPAGANRELEARNARIRSATDRMGRLLDDLLELLRTGRIDRGDRARGARGDGFTLPLARDEG